MKSLFVFRLMVTALLIHLTFGDVVAESPQQATATKETQTNLPQEFFNPPLSARPSAYWTWLNGNFTLSQISYELKEMKDKGLSGPQIFDVGASDPNGIVPAGPAFMGTESLKAIRHTVSEADRLGLEVGLTTSSSWNAGGAWVPPKHGMMGLFQSRLNVVGPKKLSQGLPFPSVPRNCPKGADGKPVYSFNVAVLAIPQPEPVRQFEFVFEISPGVPSSKNINIDHVILSNAESGNEKRYGKMHLFAKDFQVFVSATTRKNDAWQEVIQSSLKPIIKPQQFKFSPVSARFVKLVVSSGHNQKFKQIQLGEFEACTPAGENVLSSTNHGQARLLSYTSAWGVNKSYTAANIHDGHYSGRGGVWESGDPSLGIIKDANLIVDLTDQLDNKGQLTWDVPPGKWIILRYLCTNTGTQLVKASPNSGGLAIDHFSAEATKMHFEYFVNKIRKDLALPHKSALKYLYVCSYELRGQAWSPKLLDEFKTHRGYDMKCWLPVLSGATIQNKEMTQRFHYDFDKTLGDMLIENFYTTARQTSNKGGLQLCAEAGGPGLPLHPVPSDALKALGQLDRVRGEFWTDIDIWVVKETACAAHIYGKKLVDMEAFTSWNHWQNSPFELKPVADRAFCEGANHFTFHTWPLSPPQAGKPGWSYHAGTHIGPSRAWWSMSRSFIDYISRCSYMLQQGQFVGDVCYYYGDKGYNYVLQKHLDPTLGFGYDYDVTNADVLLNRMSVHNGRIVLPNNTSYAVLVLPDQEDMNLAVLNKLQSLVAAGATIVGRKPTRTNGLLNYPNQDQKICEIADKLWGPCDGKTVKEHATGKGKIIWGRDLKKILQSKGIGPDFQFTSQQKGTTLDYIHRRTSSTEIYFISNKKNRWEDVTCQFRVLGKSPELWMPDSGKTQAQLVYQTTKEGISFPLHLPPFGSIFVVFRKQEKNDNIIAFRRKGLAAPNHTNVSENHLPSALLSKNNNETELLIFQNGIYEIKTKGNDKRQVNVNDIPSPRILTGRWKVRFINKGQKAPASKNFPKLVSWTEDADENIKYFSGTAIYQKQFDLSGTLLNKQQKLILDLGKVGVVAQVELNGKPLGTLWKPPFSIDITQVAKLGKNHLEVKVANVWSNRITGDMRLDPSKRLTRLNMSKRSQKITSWNKTKLYKSGLLGPVQLIPAKRIRVNLNKK